MANRFRDLYRWLGRLKAASEEFTDDDWSAAATNSKDNPLWLLNHPDQWRTGRRWGYRAALASVWLLLVPAVWSAVARPSLEMLFGFWLASFPLQVYAELWILRSFEFIRGRQWILDELSLTPLDWKTIGYGSCHRAVHLSGIFAGAVMVSEFICLLPLMPDGGAVFALLMLPPFRWLLHGLSVSHGLRILPQPSSETQIFQVLSIPLAILARIAFAGACVVILMFISLFMLAMLAVATESEGVFQIVFLFYVIAFIAAWVGMVAMGQDLVGRGYGEAIHTYKIMVTEKDPTLWLWPDAIRQDPKEEVPFFYGKRKSDEPEETDASGAR